MSQIPRPTGCFLSITPTEPVLIFDTPDAARSYAATFPIGRIYPTSPKHVYLPLPDGMLRARAALNGSMSLEFSHAQQAANFNQMIGHIGTIYPNSAQNPQWDHNVYIGIPAAGHA